MHNEDTSELKDPFGFKTVIELAFNGEIPHGAANCFNRTRRFAGLKKRQKQFTEDWLAMHMKTTPKTIRKWLRALEGVGVLETRRLRRGILITFLADYSKRWQELCKHQEDESIPETPEDAPTVTPEATKPIPSKEPVVRIQPTKNPPEAKARELIARFGRRYNGSKSAILRDVEMCKASILQSHGQEVFNRMILQLTE